MRLHNSFLLASAGLSAVAGLAPVHGASVRVPPGRIAMVLADPVPMLAYDLSGFAEDAGVHVAPAAVDLRRVAAGDATDEALECLSNAVYFEARSEPADGQRAVAQVVLNRVGQRGFPGSVCGVVYQGLRGGRSCQFKFVCDGSMAGRREQGAWMAARRIARAVIDGEILTALRGVTFFHTRAVTPHWTTRMVRVATIGSHIFYRTARA
jgi:spore germination cell wall hydrolase CwlJ-like protein